MYNRAFLYPTNIDLSGSMLRFRDPGTEGDDSEGDEPTEAATEGTAEETIIRDPSGTLALIKKLRQEIEANSKATTKAVVPEDVKAELEALRQFKQQQETERDTVEREKLTKKGDFEKLLEKVKGDHTVQLQSLEAQIAQLRDERKAADEKLSSFTSQVEADAIEKEIVRAYYRLNGRQSKDFESIVVKALSPKARVTEAGEIQLMDGENVILNPETKQPVSLDEFLSTREDLSIFFPPKESKGTGRDPSTTRSPGTPAATGGGYSMTRAEAADFSKMRAWANTNGYKASIMDGIAKGDIKVVD